MKITILILTIILINLASALTINLETPETWYFNKTNTLEILVYNNNLTEVNIQINIIENITYTKQLTRKEKGIYQATFLIPEQNISEITLNITISDFNTINKLEKIPIKKEFFKQETLIKTGEKLDDFVKRHWMKLVGGSALLILIITFILFLKEFTKT